MQIPDVWRQSLGLIRLGMVGLVVIVGAILIGNQGGDRAPETQAVAEEGRDEPTPMVATPVVPTTPTRVPATPTRVPTPRPLPTATPVIPTPVAVAPGGSLAPQPLQTGLVHLPVAGGVLFDLPRSVDAIHQPGHCLLFPDTTQQIEIDIFQPTAGADQSPLASTEEVVRFLDDAGIGGLSYQGETTVAGYVTSIYAGVSQLNTVVFHTDPTGADRYGWNAFGHVRLWVIDGPTGPVIVTAEARSEASGRLQEAVDLAEEILAGMWFR